MILNMSDDITKCTIASFTSTKWSWKITTASGIMVMGKRFTINKSDIGFGTLPILNLNITRLWGTYIVFQNI